MRKTLDTAARAFGWKPKGRGYGMARGMYSNACNATFAEVAVDRGSGRVAAPASSICQCPPARYLTRV